MGEYNIQDINRRIADRFILELQKTAPVNTQFRKARTETLPPCTIEKICKVMHCAFRQAVRWDMIPKNPFDDVLLPKKEKKVRAIWTVDIIRQALDNCSDGKLFIAINLAFACSLRMGEITGLTWDCVHITDQDIAAISKTYNGTTIYLIYNLSETDKKEVTLSKEQYGYAEIAGYLSVDGEKVTLRGDTLTLPSYSVVVLR